MNRSMSAFLSAMALATASFAPMVYAAETPPPAADVAPGMTADPGGTVSPGNTMRKPMKPKAMHNNTPPPANDMAPGHTVHTDGMEPTAAGSGKPEPHAKAVKEAKTQFAHDKESCRENTMSKQEFRDCKKAAKMERNERFKDSPAQVPVAP